MPMHQPVLPRPTFLSARHFTAALLLLVTLCLLVGLRPARAAAAPAKNNNALATERKFFPKSLKPLTEAKKAAALTRQSVDRAATVEFQVTLRMREFAKLQNRLARGEKISDQEMQAKYLPLKSDYQATVAWAKAQGLTVLGDNPLRLGVRVRGSVEQAEQALDTRYAHVTAQGRDFLVAQTVPSLPASIAASALGITGLQPNLVAEPESPAIPLVGPFIPSDILVAYQGTNLTSLSGERLDGTNQTIAIVSTTVPLHQDIQTFWTRAKIPGRAGATYEEFITDINVNGIDPLPDPTTGETLDVSWTSGVASGALIRVYATGGNTLGDQSTALQRIVSDLQSGVKITVVSITESFSEALVGQAEAEDVSQYFAALAARGVSVYVASGDTNDAYYPATDPAVTAVGGTSLLINRDTKTIGSELAWDDVSSGASGGGESAFFSSPAYQFGNGVVITGPDGEPVPDAKRLVPDVAAAADPGASTEPPKGAYVVFSKLDDTGKPVVSELTLGGTRWSTSMWAGFGAMINQAREAAGLPDVGLLNPSIYAFRSTENFRDIVARGPRAGGANPPDFGYDLITGLGSPVLSSLITTLTNGGDLTITSFTPDSGIPGTQVTLNGTQLDKVVSVSFNGTSTTNFSVVNGTQLIVLVPGGATTGFITVTGRDGTTSTSSVPFTVLPVNAGANDLFQNAEIVGPAQTRLTGTNVGAGKEPGEPNHAGNQGGASVWYRWTPPADGIYTLNTFGSSFDTLLAVYTGDAVDNLTEVASSDDLSTTVTSSVAFQALYGTVYYFAVDGALQGNGNAAQGTVVLNLAAANSKPVFTNFTPDTGAVGQPVRIFGANFLAIKAVRFNDTVASFTIDSATQITATVPFGATTGPISLTDTDNNEATGPGPFIVVASPPNDLFANPTPIVGTQATLNGTTFGATKEAGEPSHADNAGGASVWFTWTAPNTGVFSFNTSGSNFDTLLAVYTGDNVAALADVVSNDDAGALGNSAVTFNAKGGVVYRIAIDGFNGATGSYTLNLVATSGVPVISAFSPTSGGPGVNVVLTGTGFSTVTSVKFNGTNAPGFQVNSDTQITVTVPDGATTGPITASGLSGTGTTAGNFTVATRPPNDLFANSRLLSGGAPIVVTGSNAGATKETGEPNIVAGDAGGRSIWYTYTPPAGGDYIFTTRGSDFDTLLGVFTGSTVGKLTLVASNDDDAQGGVTSSVTVTLSRGVTYRIVVDGSGGEAGNVVLSILNSSSIQNLYTTNFEPSEGFDSKKALVGQGGWLAVNAATGGNAVAVNQLPNLGQQGLVGLTALGTGFTSVQAYHPFKYAFGLGDFPIVNFSTVLRLTNSTNGHNDRFGFTPSQSADNSGSEDSSYFSLIFDNETLQIYYQYPVDRTLPSGKPSQGELIPTGVSFTHGAIYSLQMALDFQGGTWSAMLNGTAVVTGLPFYDGSNQVPTKLTRISADFTPTDAAAPGDNAMVFDQYAVSAPSKVLPVITLQPATQTALAGQPVTFAVEALGTPPLQYQWYYNGIPIAGATMSTYTIASTNPVDSGRYAVIVSNGFGSVRSLDAFLIVTTPDATPTSTVEATVKVSPVNESGGPVGSVLLTRTGDVSGALAVTYSVRGTALANVDYVGLDGRATFKAGRTKKRIKIIPLERGIRDGSEVKVTIKVLPGSGYTVGTSSKAKVFIERQ